MRAIDYRVCRVAERVFLAANTKQQELGVMRVALLSLGIVTELLTFAGYIDIL